MQPGVISANANKSFAQSVIVAWQRMTPGHQMGVPRRKMLHLRRGG